MKVTLKYYIPILLIITAISSCLDVIEPTLKDVKIQLVAPADQILSRDYLQTFYWEPDNLTEKYQIQIASPDFDAPAKFVLDSTVKRNSFVYTLQPGKYQWRVRAVNNSSQSPYSVRNLIIDTASLSNQTVVLSAPGNNYMTSNADIVFQWLPLFSAKKYTLQVDTLNFSSPDIFLEATTTANTYSLRSLKDGQYQWRVRAVNDTAQSMFSLIYNFTIDHTPPVPPVLTAPNNDALNIQLPVTLQWAAVPDAVKYKLFVYKNDGSLYDGYPVTVTSTSATFNRGNSRDKIYWQVTALDAVGNESNFSTKRNFTLQ